MLASEIINSRWSIYINGWFQHSQIIFLEDGNIDGCGTAGFKSWLYSNGDLIIADELGVVNYKLSYISEAKFWISRSEYRKHNNDIMLVPFVLDKETDIAVSDKLSLDNKMATYKGSKGEVWGNLFFGVDGKIYNYHHENESFWEIEDERLYILDKNREKKLVSEFISYSNDFLSIVLRQIHGDSKHYLIFNQNYNSETPIEQVKLDVSLSNSKDTLMVIFNSAGEEYNGYDISYEFYELPFIYNTDFIRVAQSNFSRWYLGDMETIKYLVESRNYKRVVCIGMSMGAYAAIWLNECLSQNNNEIEYVTIAIQPLTSIEIKFLEQYKQQASDCDGKRVRGPTYNVIEGYKKQGLVLDIAEFQSIKKANVLHYFVYDVLNEMEDFNALRVKSDRIKLLAIPYGTDHADGCYKIYHDGVVNKLLDKIIWDS